MTASEKSTATKEAARQNKIRDAREFLTPETAPHAPLDQKTEEVNGPAGPEPTRFGDWERKGICYDF